jgi:hypothetical protein
MENKFAQSEEGRYTSYYTRTAPASQSASAVPARSGVSIDRPVACDPLLTRTPTPPRTSAFAAKDGVEIAGASQNGLAMIVFLAGVIAIAASPFLPFISVLGVGVSLNEIRQMGGPSGLFTEILILAGASGAVWFLRLTRTLNLATVRTSAIVLGVGGLIEMATVHSRIGSSFGLVSLDVGSYALAAGSIAIIVGALLNRD